ncbi:hypothetical protein GNY23_20090 [Labilibaculum sp. 44]|uniref:Tox-MPTase4 domain-containing protein n=1 Tax=Labilibaculum euxinus TaxID=2686357 RepID=A0A7M4DBT1_9BACT|nr:hypothetical protein [Labilibaculum euxinus]MVB09315.1 hypothetical protein [Labilibaculum euxinus]
MGNNPMMNVDQNGKFWNLIISAAIGGIINWASNGAKFNAKGLGYFGVGAAAGAAGYGVGSAVAGSAQATTLGSSIAKGSVSGFYGGASGGFVSGAGNSWTNGASFGNGMNVGLNTAGTGAMMGGITGAIFSGLDYSFRRNRFVAIERNTSIETNEDGSLNPSTETLNDFSDKAFSKYKFRNKSNLIYKEGYVESINTTYGAFTDPVATNGVYDIYFSKSSFSSKWNLYNQMGHEYLHVAHLSTLGKNWVRAYSEYAAYKWNSLVSKDKYFSKMANSYFNVNILRNQSTLNNLIRPKYMQYGNWGIFTTIPKFIR